jgi:uncharacterized protein
MRYRFALVPIVVAHVCGAASFDCARAKSKVEKLICANSELDRLDIDLAATYQAAVGEALDKGALAVDQTRL